MPATGDYGQDDVIEITDSPTGPGGLDAATATARYLDNPSPWPGTCTAAIDSYGPSRALG